MHGKQVQINHASMKKFITRRYEEKASSFIIIGGIVVKWWLIILLNIFLNSYTMKTIRVNRFSSGFCSWAHRCYFFQISRPLTWYYKLDDELERLRPSWTNKENNKKMKLFFDMKKYIYLSNIMKNYICAMLIATSNMWNYGNHQQSMGLFIRRYFMFKLW